MIKKKTREVGKESEVETKKSVEQKKRERKQIKGHRNGRMAHYGRRKVFDE